MASWIMPKERSYKRGIEQRSMPDAWLWALDGDEGLKIVSGYGERVSNGLCEELSRDRGDVR
jgi:hypothetical protein